MSEEQNKFAPVVAYRVFGLSGRVSIICAACAICGDSNLNDPRKCSYDAICDHCGCQVSNTGAKKAQNAYEQTPQYKINKACNAINGYFTRGFLESWEESFERAKKECASHIPGELRDIVMSITADSYRQNYR